MKTAFGKQVLNSSFDVIEQPKRPGKQPAPHICNMKKGSFGRPFYLEELIAAETGIMTNLKAWKDFKDRSEKISLQSDDLRDLLENQGVEVYSDACPIIMTGAVTGIELVLKQKRNINLMPDVAVRNRRQQQLLFAKFAESKPYLRYMVLTSGDRIPANDPNAIRIRRATMTRRISKWANFVKKRFGINLYLSSLECPRKEEVDGSFSYHLHANLIYDGPKMSKENWKNFLSSTHNRLKYHLKDNGRLQDLNEAIKYVTKPDDFAGISGKEIAWLHHEWFRGRSFITYGKFKSFIAAAKEKRLKIVQISDGSLVFMKKNTARRLSIEEKIEELANKLGIDPANVDAQDVLDAKALSIGSNGAPENCILTITNPTTAFGPFKEPLIIHFGINHSPKNDASQKRYADFLYYRFKSLEAWEKNTRMTPDDAKKIATQLDLGENVVPLAAKREELRQETDEQNKDLYSVHNNTLIVHSSDFLKSNPSPNYSELIGREGFDPPDISNSESYLKIFNEKINGL